MRPHDPPRGIARRSPLSLAATATECGLLLSLAALSVGVPLRGLRGSLASCNPIATGGGRPPRTSAPVSSDARRNVKFSQRLHRSACGERAPAGPSADAWQCIPGVMYCVRTEIMIGSRDEQSCSSTRPRALAPALARGAPACARASHCRGRLPPTQIPPLRPLRLTSLFASRALPVRLPAPITHAFSVGYGRQK